MIMDHVITCVVTSTQQLNMTHFLNGLEASNWFKHIKSILMTSWAIVKVILIVCCVVCHLHSPLQAVADEGTSVLVHCSDGWDRTAQTCSLATLMIDPFYRTLHGFMVNVMM